VVVSKLAELEKNRPFAPADLLPVIRAFAALHDLDIPRSEFLDWAESFIFKDRCFSASHHVAVLRIAAETSWQALERNAYYRIVCAPAGGWDALSLTATETTRLLQGFHFLTQVKLRLAATMPLQVKHTDECWHARPPFGILNSTTATGGNKDKSSDGASSSKPVSVPVAAPPSMTCETACSAAWTEVDRDMRFSQRTFTSSFVHLLQEAEQRRSILLEALAPEAAGHSLVLSACRGIKCRAAFVTALDGYLDRVRTAVNEAFKPQVALFDMRSKLPDFLSPGSALPMAADAGAEARPAFVQSPLPFGVLSRPIAGSPVSAPAASKTAALGSDLKSPASEETATDSREPTRTGDTFKFGGQPAAASAPAFAFKNTAQTMDAPTSLKFSFNLSSNTKDKGDSDVKRSTKDKEDSEIKKSATPKMPPFAFPPSYPNASSGFAKAASRSVSTPTPSAADAFRDALAASQSGSTSSSPVAAAPTLNRNMSPSPVQPKTSKISKPAQG